jgi:hypothetical protein
MVEGGYHVQALVVLLDEKVPLFRVTLHLALTMEAHIRSGSRLSTFPAWVAAPGKGVPGFL